MLRLGVRILIKAPEAPAAPSSVIGLRDRLYMGG
jgi:hypothetical protein